MNLLKNTALAITLGLEANAGSASPADDASQVAALDTQYQKAVKENDAATMSRILLDDFVLVVGSGATFNKKDLIDDALSRSTTYERQDEEAGTQKVRVWGDTAVVTAKLWIRSKNAKGARDSKLWFSDTYIRTKDGWKYAFGQASLALSQ